MCSLDDVEDRLERRRSRPLFIPREVQVGGSADETLPESPELPSLRHSSAKIQLPSGRRRFQSIQPFRLVLVSPADAAENDLKEEFRLSMSNAPPEIRP